FCFFFFFQAEDGIRDLYVTGVQTCALPISSTTYVELRGRVFTVLMSSTYVVLGLGMAVAGPLTNAVGARWVWGAAAAISAAAARSEERRVGKGGRARGATGGGRREGEARSV